jgi:hypothetical protein
MKCVAFLTDENMISPACDLDPLRGDLAKDADSNARTGKLIGDLMLVVFMRRDYLPDVS